MDKRGVIDGFNGMVMAWMVKLVNGDLIAIPNKEVMGSPKVGKEITWSESAQKWIVTGEEVCTTCGLDQIGK